MAIVNDLATLVTFGASWAVLHTGRRKYSI